MGRKSTKIKCKCQNPLCNKEFMKTKSQIEYGWGKYCSNSCRTQNNWNSGSDEFKEKILSGLASYHKILNHSNLGEFKKSHKIHYNYFKNMIKRSSERKIKYEFTLTREDLKRFIEIIGPVPEKMTKPSVGRYDHNLGYIQGNFRWQEFYENTLERHQRQITAG